MENFESQEENFKFDATLKSLELFENVEFSRWCCGDDASGTSWTV